MSRAETSPAVRLKALARAKEKAARCRRGETLTFMPMANMLGISRVTLQTWCEEFPGFAASGCFEQGGNGIEYAFRPMKTVNFLIKHFEKLRDRRAAEQKRVRKIVGGDTLAAVPDDYNLDELNKIISSSIKIQDWQIRQGKLVDAERTAALLAQVFSSIQQAVMRSAMEQDPNGQWPSEVRESFEDAMRNVLTASANAARDCLMALSPSG